MLEDKVRVSARIPKELYDVCLQRYDNITNAINAGLELLRNRDSKINEDGCQTSEDGSSIRELKARVEEKDLRIGELQEQIKVNDGHQQARIEDLKAQIQTLYDQLHTKDEQIKDQNENMHKQAVHIQSLIQENSRLNIKLLPDATESKKAWWKLW